MTHRDSATAGSLENGTSSAPTSDLIPGEDTRPWRRAVEASAHAMVICSAVSPDFPIEYVNAAFEEITGYESAELVGQSCRILQGDDKAQEGIDHIRDALYAGRSVNAVVRNYRKNKSLFWNHLFIAPVRDELGTLTHFVASQYDVTETKELETKLLYLATHDDLTGLPNRTLLRDRLAQAILAAARFENQVWVAFVGLDRFKSVNDSLGHYGGDAFLRVISGRLVNAVRACDTVARWGGDEFVVILLGPLTTPLATAALERLMQAVSAGINYEGQEYVVTCSVGVAAFPTDSLVADGLLLAADTAASAARRDGSSQFRFFHHATTEVAMARLQIEAQLRTALKQNEFVLHFQPQVDLASGRIVGAEALVRWQHPTRGLLNPIEFIEIAEDCGLIVPLGAWVLRAACAQIQMWQKCGLPRIRVAVNLSAGQFVRGDLAASIASVLQETELDGADLELELTESVVMRNVEHGIEALGSLHELGVSIAIDDFGTGYSSLAYLKRFPIDVLKIDRSFVNDLTDMDGDDAAIVNSIIALAHTLKLKVVAEGVETIGQLRYLQRYGCDEIQGYYVSRPLTVEEFSKLLTVGIEDCAIII